MKFSIITVCYNSGKTISRAIQSVLDQTFVDYEYIIVDGNSTDLTLEIIKKYQPLFSGKLRYVSENDSGIYNAMNKGAAMATGDYLLFLNSDDYYSSEMLDNLDRNSSLKQANILYGDIHFIGEDKSFIWKAHLDEICFQMCMGHIGTAIMKQTFLDCAGFDESYSVAADWDLFLRAFLAGKSFQYCPGAFSYFIAGGLSSVSDFSHEHEKLIKKNLTPYISLDYREIRTLHCCDQSIDENERDKIFQKISFGNTDNICKLFVSNYSRYINRVYRERISRIENSTSWKITSPVRKILDVFR